MAAHVLLFMVTMLISGVSGGVLKKESEGNFLNGPVKPAIVAGSSGRIVEIDEKPQLSRKSKKNDINNLLGQILETVNSKKELVVPDSANVRAPEKQVPRNDVKKQQKLSFNQLEKTLDSLIEKMSVNANTEKSLDSPSIDISNNNNRKFKDFANVNEVKNPVSENSENVMSFDDFRRAFFKLFVEPESKREPSTVTVDSSGNKRSPPNTIMESVEKVDKKEVKLRNDLSDVYNELKAETRKETERKIPEKRRKIEMLKKEVDYDLMREKEKETKKREIVSLLNKILGNDDLVYNDGRVEMADEKTERQYHPNNADQDFKRLFNDAKTRRTMDSNGDTERFPRISKKRNNENNEKSKRKELDSILKNLADVLESRDKEGEEASVNNQVDDTHADYRPPMKSLPLPDHDNNQVAESDERTKLRDVLLNINDVLTSVIGKEKRSSSSHENNDVIVEDNHRDDVDDAINEKLKELLADLKGVMKRSESDSNPSQNSNNQDKEFLEALKGFDIHEHVEQHNRP